MTHARDLYTFSPIPEDGSRVSFTPLSSPPPWHVQRQLKALARLRESEGALVQ